MREKDRYWGLEERWECRFRSGLVGKRREVEVWDVKTVVDDDNGMSSDE